MMGGLPLPFVGRQSVSLTRIEISRRHSIREAQSMDAAVHKVTSGFIGKVVFSVGLSFFMGCSQQTASKPQEATAPQKVEAKQKSSKRHPPKRRPRASRLFKKELWAKVLKKVPFETSTSTLIVTIFVQMPGTSLKVTLHGSKRILKSGSRSKGIVTSVEPASITSHWELKEQRAQNVTSSISESRRVRFRPSATVKSFLCARSRMKPAGQRIGARTLS